ncbi:NADPH:quinone oxidoreductase family protein [Phaeobacter gallaeciensis]|uniref:NADPH:quinone oxidoreductase family protein n=1 Tax=Phaeobacter gallaeciensis TaxID=60890 RepID=UPI00237FD0B3|nr:NADPH:quinone oxidoreductase family protein [Phaeobacter gallaeciensis]MDE4098782.1 NADPH:quinone oxidoreductase family protein [Phaeobacter gallaeciensis]MDE4107461.1 NADPH:quinone oxidoreductase family protein [Phaeobacter gallaeciensis]MDE4111915.1 NADPH:quinone oxidoreductase family protein [Phaeobacter gallaeciensis]MDE4116517.1 NADPH:quinone oxidoreductase family protein [Phaeobacter gallaeciensis]MDE4120988.1 NADPH:quinone oxidoreductase family protein [Phaeobacter gallaeciensis]
MQAYQVTAFDAAPKLIEIASPAPAAGQIAVRIEACGLNFADLLMQKGTYQDTPTLPFVPGLEVSGTVTALGETVTEFKIGDRVAVFCGQGGLAEEGVFDASRAVRIPDSMSFEHAAALQIAYGTSLVALDHCARLQPGETLLVTGAAGGVGLTAVEIGKLMGARVIAHARGADKLEVARAAGADHLIDDSEDLRSIVKDLGGADVVYDAVGGPVWKAAFRATNPCGRLLPIGFASGEVPQIPANHLLVKNLTVIGFYIGGYMKARPEVIQQAFATLFDWHAAGRIKPHISHVLPLSQVTEGMELLRSRASTGKVVITP